MTGKYRRGGYVKKKEDGFSGHVKRKGEGLGISAIFIKKYKTSQKLVLAWLIIILVEGIQQ